MAEPLSVGAVVRVTLDDPLVHTRAPRYVRGRTGHIVEFHGVHAVPDDVVSGVSPPAREPVYAVRFTARELFGTGAHSVTVNLWQRYLQEGP
jgi:nitrile hydratase subunit beta